MSFVCKKKRKKKEQKKMSNFNGRVNLIFEFGFGVPPQKERNGLCVFLGFPDSTASPTAKMLIQLICEVSSWSRVRRASDNLFPVLQHLRQLRVRALVRALSNGGVNH
jgi:hypothetical protein